MKKFVLSLLLVGLMATFASAAAVSAFTQIDPGTTLPGYVANTWDVDTGAGEFLSAQLLIQLDSGHIYQDSMGSNNPPDPGFFGFVPTLEFDTYITGGKNGAEKIDPSIIGGAVDLGGAPGVTIDSALIDAAWTTSAATNPVGQLMLGQFTLSSDAMGTFAYRLGVKNEDPIIETRGVVEGGVMTVVPEPTTIVMLLCGALGLLAFRRK